MSSELAVGATFGSTTATVPSDAGKVSAAQIVASLEAQMTSSEKAGRTRALLKHHGYRLAIKALEPDRLIVRWYEVPPGGKLRAKGRQKPVLIATGTLTFRTARTAPIDLELTARGKLLLEHAKRERLSAEGTFTPAGQRPITATKAFTLTR